MPDEDRIVRRSEEDGVELLMLRHPPVNALGTGVIDELDRRIGELPASTRALIVTGDGAYFSAGADWYVCELDRETGEMFGHCDLGLGFPEWGYVRIQDLAELRGQFGLPVERELDFMPKTARELGLVKP